MSYYIVRTCQSRPETDCDKKSFLLLKVVTFIDFFLNLLFQNCIRIYDNLKQIFYQTHMNLKSKSIKKTFECNLMNF